MSTAEMNNILIPTIMLVSDIVRERQIRDATGLTDKTTESEEDLQLRESIRLNGILNPLIVHEETKTLICGHRRHRQAQALGLTEVTVRLYRGPLTPTTRLTLQWAENFGRVDLTPFQKHRACVELRKLNPTWTYRQIAAVLGVKSEALICQYLSVEDCPPEVQKAFELGEVTLAHCYHFNRLPEEAKQEVLATGVTSFTRDDMARTARNQRNGTADKAPVRQTRLVLPLSGSRSVIVTGPVGTLAEHVETVMEALRHMKKADADCQDGKTLAAILKNKLKGS